MQIEKNITSKQVREILGGISDMSLWRFLHDKHLNFPKPIYINRRRLWSHQELKDWLDKQPRIYRPNR
jgi:predicted DNA-binding transcriptional regulator AlpA